MSNPWEEGWAPEPEPEGDRPWTLESWVYLGPHPSDPKLVQWRDGQGEIRLFATKLKGRVFGGIYEVRASRPDAERLVVHGGIGAYTGRRSEDAAQIEIQALEGERRAKLKRLEASTSRTATVDEAIKPLLALAAGLLSYSDKQALLDYVGAKVMSVRRPGKN